MKITDKYLDNNLRMIRTEYLSTFVIKAEAKQMIAIFVKEITVRCFFVHGIEWTRQ
jgi:hypothetical protein